MATESMSHIKSGPIAGKSMYFRADAANTPLWAPVVVKTAVSGYSLPEVGTTNTAADPKVIGVSCGPLADTTNYYCNTSAGEDVEVCVWGIVKCKVDGTDAIADGDALMAHATGLAQLCAIDCPTTYLAATLDTLFGYALGVFAMALEAATADGDTIPVFVYGARGTQT